MLLQPSINNKKELIQFKFYKIIFKLYKYKKLKKPLIKLIKQIEMGEFYSSTLRDILFSYHGVEVGAYSYGSCMVPGAFPSGVVVGRYCSIGENVNVFLRNHPFDHLSLHPFFYNSLLGFVKNDTISTGNLHIGHDAWLGSNSMIAPGCSRIGIGAIVGAGSVVTKDVDDFAIVAGNPAEIIRYRFDETICDSIIKSRWWEKSIHELKNHIVDMNLNLSKGYKNHSLLCNGYTE